MSVFKFETDDGRNCCVIVIGIVLVILVGIIIGCKCKTDILTAYIENGYSRQTLQGASCATWVKE